MPAGDRTGPVGQGPMTGRAAGYCAGYNLPGHTNNVNGRGFGFGGGRGGGRGWRNRLYATGLTGWQRRESMGAPYAPRGRFHEPVPDAAAHARQLDALKEQAQYLEDELGSICKQIEVLETQP